MPGYATRIQTELIEQYSRSRRLWCQWLWTSEYLNGIVIREKGATDKKFCWDWRVQKNKSGHGVLA